MSSFWSFLISLWIMNGTFKSKNDNCDRQIWPVIIFNQSPKIAEFNQLLIFCYFNNFRGLWLRSRVSVWFISLHLGWLEIQSKDAQMSGRFSGICLSGRPRGLIGGRQLNYFFIHMKIETYIIHMHICVIDRSID